MPRRTKAGHPPRRRRTRAEWSAIIDRWRAGGRPEAEYCRREGLTLSTFRWWRRRLGGARRTEAPAGSGRFVTCEVPLMPPAAESALVPAGGELEVFIRGDERQARFSASCPRELVVAVVESLQGRSCS